MKKYYKISSNVQTQKELAGKDFGTSINGRQ